MKLALGTAQFGMPYGVANQTGQVTQQEATAIMQLAANHGIDTLDTAIAYGESEQTLGEIGIQGWQIVSKLPAIPDDCNAFLPWVTTAVDGSLKRLNVKNLYGLLLHRPHQLMGKNGDDLYRALQQIKQDGMVQKIGISIYDPSELDALCDRFEFDLVQAPFNLLDCRLIHTGWLHRLADRGIELHVRSVFLQGLLLMKPSERPKIFNRWDTLWSQWDQWLDHTGLTPLQACLRYSLSFPQIRKVVVGVDSLKQLKEILLASAGPSPQIPVGLTTADTELLSPAKWASFT